MTAPAGRVAALIQQQCFANATLSATALTCAAAPQTAAQIAMGYASTAGSWALSGLSIVAQIQTATTILRMIHRTELVTGIFQRYCPALAHDPYAQEKNKDVRSWFIEHFGVHPENLPEGITMPTAEELRSFRDGVLKDTDVRTVLDIKTLGIAEGKNLRLSSQAVVALMPSDIENKITYIDPHYYTLWTFQRPEEKTGNTEDIEYKLYRGASKEHEVLTMSRLAYNLPAEIFDNDLIVFPCLDSHKVESESAQDQANSLAWGVAVFEPKSKKLKLIYPDIQNADQRSLFTKSFDAWKDNAKEFVARLGKHLGDESISNSSNIQVELVQGAKVDDIADTSIFALDMMHAIKEHVKSDIELDDLGETVRYRRYQYARQLALGEKTPSPKLKQYSVQASAEDAASSKDVEEDSIASRVKLKRRK